MKKRILDWACGIWLAYLFYRYWHFGISELGLVAMCSVLVGARMIANAIKESACPCGSRELQRARTAGSDDSEPRLVTMSRS